MIEINIGAMMAILMLNPKDIKIEDGINIKDIKGIINLHMVRSVSL